MIRRTFIKLIAAVMIGVNSTLDLSPEVEEFDPLEFVAYVDKLLTEQMLRWMDEYDKTLWHPPNA